MSDPDIRMTDDLEVVVRRSPRYGVFILAGIFLGFIAAGILVVVPVDTSVLTADYSTGTAMAFLMLVLGLVGAAGGSAVALVLDRINARKVRTYTVRGEYVARSIPRTGAGGPDFSANGDRPHAAATVQSGADEDPEALDPERGTDGPAATGDVKQ